MHAYAPTRMDINIYVTICSVMSSQAFTFQYIVVVVGNNPRHRQFESLPVVVVLMKGIGAWLLGV